MAPGRISQTPVGGAEDVTLGEVYRYLLAFERRTLDAFKHSDDRLTQALATMLRADVYDARHGDVLARLDKIEQVEVTVNNRAWSTRQTLAISVMAAAVGSGLGGMIAALAAH